MELLALGTAIYTGYKYSFWLAAFLAFLFIGMSSANRSLEREVEELKSKLSSKQSEIDDLEAELEEYKGNSDEGISYYE